MPFEKYEPLKPEKICSHPGHNPPGHMVFREGHYTWRCPSCGHLTSFTVINPRLKVERKDPDVWRNSATMAVANQNPLRTVRSAGLRALLVCGRAGNRVLGLLRSH